MLKAFYGRYYNNLADGFSSANPGGTNYAEYNFLDQNRNGRYDGPSRARRAAAAHRRRDRRRSNPDLKTPYTDEISGSLEHQFWGESSRAAHLRAQEPARLRAVLRHAARPGVAGQLDRADASSSTAAKRSTCVDVPASIADQTNGAVRQLPGRRLPLRHDRGRVQQAVQRPVLLPDAASITSGATSCARRDIANCGRRARRQRRSDRRQLLSSTPNPAAPNRQEIDDVPLAVVGPLHVPDGCRLRGQLPVPERLPVLAHHRRTATRRRR